MIQTTFGGFLQTTGGVGAAPYVFHFYNSTCALATSPISLAASGLMLHYANVSGLDPGANAVKDQLGGPSSNSTTGNATTSTAFPAASSTFTAPTVSSQTWNATARYVSLGSNCAAGSNTNVATCATTVTDPGTITDFNFTFNAAPPNGTTFTITMMHNGAVGTGSTPALSPALQPGTRALPNRKQTVAAGDTIELRVQRTGGTGTLKTTVVATTNASETSTVKYVSLSTQCISATSSTCNVTTVPSPGGTLTSANLTLGAVVPTGDTYTVTLYKNGASTGLTCAITQGRSSCQTAIGGTLSFASAGTDKVELEIERTGGSTLLTTTVTSATITELLGGLTVTAPGVSTTKAGDLVIRIYGTGATSFSTTTTPPPAQSIGPSTATGADDAMQPVINSTPASLATTVTSGAQANWAGQTISLALSAPASLSVPAPSAVAVGDFLLATVTAQGIGSTNTICAPTGWTQIGTTSTSPASGGTSSVSEATFRKLYTASETPPYAFTFGASCTGGTAVTPVNAEATGMIVRYTGVTTASPIDGTPPAASIGTNGTAASPITAPGYTTTLNGDQIVRLYGTGSTSFVSGAGARVERVGPGDEQRHQRHGADDRRPDRLRLIDPEQHVRQLERPNRCARAERVADDHPSGNACLRRPDRRLGHRPSDDRFRQRLHLRARLDLDPHPAVEDEHQRRADLRNRRGSDHARELLERPRNVGCRVVRLHVPDNDLQYDRHRPSR